MGACLQVIFVCQILNVSSETTVVSSATCVKHHATSVFPVSGVSYQMPGVSTVTCVVLCVSANQLSVNLEMKRGDRPS